MSTNLVPQLCFVPSSSGIDFPLGPLALWHLDTLAYYKAAIFSSMYAFWLIFSISDDGEGAVYEPYPYDWLDCDYGDDDDDFDYGDDDDGVVYNQHDKMSSLRKMIVSDHFL